MSDILHPSLIGLDDVLYTSTSPSVSNKSPFDTLPTELITQIFSYTTNSTPISLHSMPEIWTLAHVSARWRSVVCNIPWIWSNIEIDVDQSASKNDSSMEILDAYLTRSYNRPLHVSIKRSIRLALVDQSPTSSKALQRYLSRLLPHAERLEFISVHGLFSDELALFEPMRGRLASLKSLELYIHHEPQNDHMEPNDVFLSAPSLSHIKLSGTHLEGSHPMLELPWGQLRSYHGCRPNLLAASDLEECIISCRCGTLGELRHDRLESLSIPSPDPLRQASLPQLKQLNVKLMSSEDILLVTQFLRSEPLSLQHLTLTGRFQSSAQTMTAPLRDLFSAPGASDIRGLNWDVSEGIHAVCSLLTAPSNEQRCLLPKLEELTVRSSASIEGEAMLMGMVTSRFGKTKGPSDVTVRARARSNAQAQEGIRKVEGVRWNTV
ncbi:hypothetical protein VNI00_012155 [Paramarasmius palmivorus]|uniref:F-box domain-containing protein n=1 Tax=Paramarasmius palmivorus TaxID=297713 RepID=A0AAW0C6Z8_9AGAR